MAKVKRPKGGFNPSRMRLVATLSISWVVFATLIPSFLMRLYANETPWVNALTWAVGIVLFAGLTGYLCLGFLGERKISLLVFFGILLILVSQGYRTAVTLGYFSEAVMTTWQDPLRAADNLANGIGISLIALAFLFVIIEILASRQELLLEHALLTEEVSRRETVERNLREREALLQGINASALDAIMVMDHEGFVDFWNPAAERILGYTAEEMRGRRLHEALAPSNIHDVTAGGISNWQRTGQGPLVGRTTTHRAITKNGVEIDVDISVSSMEVGGQWRAVGIMRDITEHKRLEEERLELEAKIQHTQKLEALGVLAGGIAHDFNNILQIILGNVDMLEKDAPPESFQRRCLDKIRKSIVRASSLTNQMLAYAGKRSVALETLSIGDALLELVQFLQSSVSKKITLRTCFESELPCIEADAVQVEQVVMNLAMNASEAIDEEQGGVVTIVVKAQHCTQEYLDQSRVLCKASEGEYVCIEVSDTGCGMSDETVEKLFEPFFTTKFTGRGLGMSAVLGIMRAHRGALMVESAPGKGTVIRALFPVSDKTKSYALRKESRPSSVPIAAPALSAPRRVLIVDDEPDVLELGVFMLSQLGCETAAASNGLEAVKLYRDQHGSIDCVLLDMSMPGMDGLQTLRGLLEINPEARVILASGYGEQDLESRFAGHDVRAFLAKPYRLEVLAETLEKAMR